MPLTFQTNSSNDLFIGADGNLAIITGIDTIVQQCEEIMETLRGELIYDKTRGIDYQSTLWDGAPDLVRFERQARNQLLTVETVTQVRNFETTITNDILSYRAIIDTTLGTGTISSGL